MKAETVILPDGKEVTLIHYIDPSSGKIVCMPNLLLKDMGTSKMRIAPHIRSDYAGAVTCPMCKNTQEWKAARK